MFEDLREECSKYGQVVEVKVPRPANPALSAALFGTDNYGKVRPGPRPLLLVGPCCAVAAWAVCVCPALFGTHHCSQVGRKESRGIVLLGPGV